MSEHISEPRLEKYILDPASFDSHEREQIEEHVKSCALCKEHAEMYRTYFNDLQKHLGSPPTSRDRETALSIMSENRPSLPERGLERTTPEDQVINAYAEIVEHYRSRLVRRITRYVRIHPVRSAGGFAFVVGALALLAQLVFPPKDRDLAYAEITSHVLNAYNKEAEIIWKKAVPGYPDWNEHIGQDPAASPRRWLLVTDLDGDGRREILVVGLKDGSKVQMIR